MCVAAAACGLSELLGRASVRRGGGARLGSTPRRPPRRETPSKRSDSNSTDRPGAERRRAVNATAPSTPARVRVARARVFLSRPVCSPRLLGRGSPCLRTLGLTVLSHPSRCVQSTLKSPCPTVWSCQSLERRKRLAERVFLGLCRPRPEPLSSTSRPSPGSPARFRPALLAPPARGLATRLRGPKDAERTRARAALGHATSSDHGHPSIGPLHGHEGAARVS